MPTPANQPDVLLLGLCCIAMFCFYSFPMVIFSWLSQSNRRLTINPCSYIWLWELNCKEGRTPKNWCFQTVVLEKIPETPMTSKETKPVSLKGNQPWILIWKTDTEVSVFWSPDVNSQLIGKIPDAGKGWGQKKRASEDEMTGWHHWCNRLHELGQISGNSEGQGGLVCCSPWGHRVGHNWATK